LGDIERISISSCHKPLITNVPKAQKIEKKVENVPSSDDKQQIAARIEAILTKWSQDCSSKEATKEFPVTLTSFERSVVHKWAEENGYNHLSIGEQHNRRIIVRTKSATHSHTKEMDESEMKIGSGHIKGLLELNLNDKIENEPQVEAGKKLLPEMQNLKINKEQPKKKKNCKPKTLEQKKLVDSGQETSDSAIVLKSSDAKCDNCQKAVPRSNLALHQFRCSGIETTV
jgi:hypothetical protein